MTDAPVIRQMTRPEVDTLVGWAAAEGWNPGLHDAELFWATDPGTSAGFLASGLNGCMPAQSCGESTL